MALVEKGAISVVKKTVLERRRKTKWTRDHPGRKVELRVRAVVKRSGLRFAVSDGGLGNVQTEVGRGQR